MAATVVTNPTAFTMTVDPGGTPQVIDLCSYVRAVRIAPAAAEIDISTFCASATELGPPTYSIVAAFLWSPELYEALQPHVGKVMQFDLKPGDQAASKVIRWDGKYAFAPFGSFELGSRVESDLPIAVMTAPDYVNEA